MTRNFFPQMKRQGQIGYLTMADGTRLRTASWPSREDSRGIIVLVNGHQEYMEKYGEFISDFLERGFAFYSLDNRGQGLSDRLIPSRLKSHVEDFDLFSNDLNEFIARTVMTDPRARELPVCLMGHSMGGHICLRYLHDFPGIVDRSIVMAPMVKFYLGPSFTSIVINPLIRIACLMGFGKTTAFGQGSTNSRGYHFIRRKLLTHDRQRYDVEGGIIEADPDLYVGGATFGWLNKALESIEKIRRPGYLDEISTPVLAVLAGEDKVVESGASRTLLSGHENIRVVTIKGARHEIYRETDQYRNQLWQEIDDFLGSYASPSRSSTCSCNDSVAEATT